MPEGKHTGIMCNRRLTWLLILLGLLSHRAQGERLPIRTYTTTDGLAHNHINRIWSDSRGFLWFCTDEGLSRFDGYGFTNHTRADGLPHNHVNDLLEAKDGSYWIATDGGVCRFNPAGEPARQAASGSERPSQGSMFIVYHPSERENSNRVNRLLEGSDGTIWCATNDGLFRLRHPRDEVHFEEVDLGLRHETIDDPHVSTLAIDPRDGLWAGAIRGLFRVLPDGRVEHFTRQNGLPGEFVQTLFADRDGRLWAGTRIDGFCRLVVEPDVHRPVVERSWSTKDGLPSADVRQIFRTYDGKLWVATRGGLSEFTEMADGRVRFHNYAVVNGLSENGVFKLAEDLDGNLWLGTFQTGVMRIARPGFVTYGDSDGYHARDFNCIFEDSSGELIVVSVGDNHGGIQRFRNGKFSAIRPAIPASRLNFGTTHQHGTFQDSAGEWWLPTDYGLVRFPRIKRVEELARVRPKAIYTTRDGLPFDGVHRLYEDSHGDIWIATQSSAGEYGLSCWERASATFRRYTEADGLPSLKLHTPLAFVEDAAGNLWIGFSQRGGLARFHNGHFDLLTPLDGVPTDDLNALFFDHAGRLWLASNEGGLGRVDDPAAEHPHFVAYTTAEGLSSNEVWCLAEDRMGRIYAGTGRGVDRLEPETGRFRRYNTADGLAQGTMGVMYCDRQGTLWCVTNRGISRLDPLPDREPAAPPILLTGLRINGTPQRVSELGQTATEKLELAPQRNSVQIDFLGLDFAPGDVLRYQYRLEGADMDWSAPTDQRTVNYPSLPSGRYRFLVRAVTGDGVISEANAIVSFRILPPLWLRWWVLTLATALAGLAVYSIHRYRVGRLLDLERVRTRIATDLHDDIGASLSRMAILSEVVKRQLGTDQQSVPILTEIADSARGLSGSMRDVVWSIDPRHDDLSSLISRVRQFAADVLEPKGIKCDFEAPIQAQGIKLDPDDRRHLLLIFKEAINNIVRHADCNSVSLGISIDHNKIRAEIRDDGRGFTCLVAETAGAESGRGHGVNNMRARAAQLGGRLTIQSSPGLGTKLELIVPLKKR